MAKVVFVCFFVFVAAVCMIGVAAEDDTWCVANPSVTNDQALQANIDFACGKIDCSSIQKGGNCFLPDNVHAHASVAMNMYYQKNKRDPDACVFYSQITLSKTGLITRDNPSQIGGCNYTTTA